MGQNNKKQLIRCPWVDLSKPDYVKYHDQEWGVPGHNDQKLFEFLVLESAQAGLSWYTVLKKRENYRKAFNGFDPEKVAKYNDKKVEKLLGNAGIIRNRLKIQSTISNAQKFLAIVEEYGSFDAYVWRFVDGSPVVNHWKSLDDYPATSKASDVFSQDLKQRGFKFVGSTICYAFMQATGMVNDHSLDCYRRQQILDAY
ncbi:MAG: DNA-3-methyladenine glycosylase I [Deltaproteobacteria bacterium]|jgi:DNA-3-methyladenine glycosylase I|nr:DNA-3-methyladenine glycosylase I [Deltaproteobacteria bacterium]MBT4526026.1 DNA-3-methyladenine glycosylase I [Deltaproteobacteria bacterium]